jgi:hypothetical protein
MEHGAASEAQLWPVARVMSAQEYEQARCVGAALFLCCCQCHRALSLRLSIVASHCADWHFMRLTGMPPLCLPRRALQVAEERSLAGKCGNPLCSQPPAGSQGSSGGGRYHISTREQAVYERPGDEDQPVYCTQQCEAAVKQFGVRLGSAALALERFSAMYQQLQAQKPPQQQATAPSGASQAPAQAEPAAAAAAAASPAPAAEGPEAPARQPPAVISGAQGGSCPDSVPGGIRSSATLAPRLAVEQVEVKRIDSSAGQFGDFSRKIKPRTALSVAAPAAAAAPSGRAGASAGAASSSAAAAAAAAAGPPKPKSVLKKQSQFAAGTTKVPIMLAEVKVGVPARQLLKHRRSGSFAARLLGAPQRDGLCSLLVCCVAAASSYSVDAQPCPPLPPVLPGLALWPQERDASMVAADTARSLSTAGAAASGSSGGRSRSRSNSQAASAVEGYVPRAANPQQHGASSSGQEQQQAQQQHRRVRFSDESEQGPAEWQQQQQLQQQQPQQHGTAASLASPAASSSIGTATAGVLSSAAPPRSHSSRSPSAAPAAPAAAPHNGGAAPVAAPAGSVLVFELEDPKGPLDAGKNGLTAQLGRLRVADSMDLPTAAAAVAATAASTSRTAAITAASNTPSSSTPMQGIPIKGRPTVAIGVGGGAVATRELREVPQFYAHSPVGSSSNLSGSLAAAASSPPRAGGGRGAPARLVQSPPGLPRGPSSSASPSGISSQAAAPAAEHRAAQQQQQQQPPAAEEARPDSSSVLEPPPQQQQQQDEAAPADQQQPGLTKRQAEQLQVAFPPLFAVLPPELQAALASDTESEAAESEDWMESDEDDDLEAGAAEGR